MGRETNEWRKKNYLIGLGKDLARHEGDWYRKRLGDMATAWWDDGTFENLYPYYIPVEAVEELFAFEIDADDLLYRVPCEIDDERMSGIYPEGHRRAGQPFRIVTSRARQVVWGSRDPDTEFGVFGKDSFRHNQLRTVLVDMPAALLDTNTRDLGFGSAMLMRGGAVGVTTLDLPEAITIVDLGFTYRPSLTMVDSYNGELKMGAYITARTPVCENGAASYTGSAPKRFTLKHTGNHQERIGEMRQALGFLWKGVDTIDQELRALAQWGVKPVDFMRVVDVVVPIPEEKRDDDGNVTNNRAITNAVKKRAQLHDLYNSDVRASTWNGTALGVFQTFNTWAQHERVFRASTGRAGSMGGQEQTDTEGEDVDGMGVAVSTVVGSGATTDRIERNWLNVLRGTQSKDDAAVLHTLAAVQGVRFEEMVPV